MVEENKKRFTAAQALEKAKECRELAQRVWSPEYRVALINMAKAWEELARSMPTGNDK